MLVEILLLEFLFAVVIALGIVGLTKARQALLEGLEILGRRGPLQFCKCAEAW